MPQKTRLVIVSLCLFLNFFVLFLQEEEWDGSINEEACSVAESEECLMRRALADDHLDYIYTQDIKS